VSAELHRVPLLPDEFDRLRLNLLQHGTASARADLAVWFRQYALQWSAQAFCPWYMERGDVAGVVLAHLLSYMDVIARNYEPGREAPFAFLYVACLRAMARYRAAHDRHYGMIVQDAMDDLAEDWCVRSSSPSVMVENQEQYRLLRRQLLEGVRSFRFPSFARYYLWVVRVWFRDGEEPQDPPRITHRRVPRVIWDAAVCHFRAMRAAAEETTLVAAARYRIHRRTTAEDDDDAET